MEEDGINQNKPITNSTHLSPRKPQTIDPPLDLLVEQHKLVEVHPTVAIAIDPVHHILPHEVLVHHVHLLQRQHPVNTLFDLVPFQMTILVFIQVIEPCAGSSDNVPVNRFLLHNIGEVIHGQIFLGHEFEPI